MYKLFPHGQTTIIKVQRNNSNLLSKKIIENLKEVINMILGVGVVFTGLVGFGYSIIQIVNIGSGLF